MRIAFPYSGYWPYVRRGVERCTHDMATFLAERGHAVDVISSTPGRPRVDRDGLARVTYLRQCNHPLLFRYLPLARIGLYAAEASLELARLRPDVAHLWSHCGIRWARLLGRLIDLPYVFQMSVYWTPGEGRRWFPEALGARRVLALNRGMAAAVEAEFGMPCDVLPPPVDLSVFRPTGRRDPRRPRVFFPADLADPRKGGALLLRAWNQVHRRHPEAELVLGGSLGVAGWLQDQDGVSTLSKLDLISDPAAREAIDLRGPGALGSLPAWYSEAAVTVLPSIDEAFGMVLTESLACGTPVVASAHCGPGEIIGDSGLGVKVDLREPSDLVSMQRADELAEAIGEAIELSRLRGCADRCREWAGQWGLDRVGLQVEQILEEAASPDHGAAAGPVAPAPEQPREADLAGVP